MTQPPLVNGKNSRLTALVRENSQLPVRGSLDQDLPGRWFRDRKSSEHRWSIILAGGEGVRLRGLTRFVCGDDRPKQFCPLLGKSTLLGDARQRAERSVSPNHILYSLTLAHQGYYLRDLWDRPSQIIVQPCNKGTAPAILYTLLHVAQMDPEAVVAILPCDHYYSRESIFTGALESAFAIAEARPESIVLLGAQPNAPEVEYGWIELGAAVDPHPDAFHVTRFHEKPPLAIAEHLLKSGSLWNTFVMVGRVSAFFDLALASVPALLQALHSVPVSSTSDGEKRVAEIYDRIDSADFSRQILLPGARRLLALRLGDVEWSDLGDPDRVMHALLESGVQLPGWATRWAKDGTSQTDHVDTDIAAITQTGVWTSKSEDKEGTAIASGVIE